MTICENLGKRARLAIIVVALGCTFPAFGAWAAAGQAVETSKTTDLIAGIVFCGMIFLAIAGPLSAGPIYRRFGYRVFLNWNVLLWLFGFIAIGVGAFVWNKERPPQLESIALTGIVLLPWLMAVFLNIRRTDLLVGLWISLVQLPWSLIAVVGVFLVNGLLHAGSYEEKQQAYFRRKGITD